MDVIVRAGSSPAPSTLITLFYCFFLNAEVAQLVEHNLAKVGVASSSLVSRSSFPASILSRLFCLLPRQLGLCFGWVAEWSCSGLQSRGRRFDSDPSLHFPFRWRGGMVYTQDLKSCAPDRACGFESHRQYSPHLNRDPCFPVRAARSAALHGCAETASQYVRSSGPAPRWWSRRSRQSTDLGLPDPLH